MHGRVADLIGVALLVAGGAMTILLNFMLPPWTEQEIATAGKADPRYATETLRMCSIYKASGDISSFKLIKAVRTSSGDLCVQYRIDTGPRAFMATSTAAEATGPSQLQDVPTCDGVRGKEITRAIRDRLNSC